MFEPNKNRIFPILMATQHPDNAGIPFWTKDAMIPTSKETEEMMVCFFDLNCDEYMWDWEGKFADEAMIERLMSSYLDSFQEEQLGRDRFITLRIPNIWEEKTYKLSRAYMSVISGAEVAKSLNMHTPPVFEFILPMTKSGEQVVHIQKTFRALAKMQGEVFGDNDFGTCYIHMIPLLERVEDFYNAGKIMEDFITLHEEEFGYKPPYLRPFIARSDPALNAGFVPAVLGSRMALREFYRIGEKHGIKVYPIIGTGSLPFRGGINPENIHESLKQYEGVKTVSIQSAFRYDYPLSEVKEALSYIKKELQDPKPVKFEDAEFEALNEICKIFMSCYQSTIEEYADEINEMAKFVPSRRERVQHTGLFGYGREMGKVSLPRAIKFTASCYSMGVPPEFIGTGRALKQIQLNGEMALLKKHFPTLEHELKHAGKYLNLENLRFWAQSESWAKDILEDIKICEEVLGISFGPSKDNHHLHKILTSAIALKKRMGLDLSSDVLEASVLRKSLG